ncbi:MAG: Uma2 family endonuclease [Janthinobacterium lividum]
MAILEAEIQATEIQPGMKITEDELMRLPKDGRKWELVDGRLTEVPTSIKHEEIIFNLTFRLGPFVRGHGLVTFGQGSFRMTDGNIRAPEGFGNLAPDLCVEIVSPSEKKADMARKVAEYFERGAVQVWQAFPERQEVTVFTSPTKRQTMKGADILDAGGILPGFSCRVSDLFEME